MNFANGLPSFIEIETSNKCNRACDWCPTGHDKSRRNQTLMEWTLFAAILEQLSDLSYSGWLALHNYNEPLLNARLLEEIAFAKATVTGTQLSIFTNGDLLDGGRLTALIDAGVVYVRVTRYPKRNVQNETDPAAVLNEWLRRQGLWEEYPWQIREVPQGLSAEAKSSGVWLQVIRPNIGSYNYRGGTVPDLAGAGRTSPCLLTTTSAAIDRLGRMKMCCNVYPGEETHQEYIIGSLSEHTFTELWFSARMKDLRARHIRTDWSRSPICVGCSHRI